MSYADELQFDWVRLMEFHTDVFTALPGTLEADAGITSIPVLSLQAVEQLPSRQLQYAHLLLLRHHFTAQLAQSNGLYPPYIIARAKVYEALGYADLATADAFVAYTLCEVVLSDEWISDLQPQERSGNDWPDEGLELALSCQVDTLLVLCRTLDRLGAMRDRDEKRVELMKRYAELQPSKTTQSIEAEISKLLSTAFCINKIQHVDTESQSRFGRGRREVYPWNEHEPNRNSPQSVLDINSILAKSAPNLEAKMTSLPPLDDSVEPWYQLGLFARVPLKPSATILREKSILTAIRPLDDALCDACGANLESIDRDELVQCPGHACDTTFCSKDCATRAMCEYHKPDLEQNDDYINTDYPPAPTPFCGNTVLQEIGRATSTDTPEWDLYFLLLTRTVQIALTRDTHPLQLTEVKYLWGDFDPCPATRLTLPFSLYHHVALPLQYFETLMQSVPSVRPYDEYWMLFFDWWIIQTLFAKFRGVANAQQSTFDGKAEIAAVHPMWCLANHSCSPNVRWSPTGTREFQVLDKEQKTNAYYPVDWDGIQAGEEIWSHYTDINLPLQQRRERLQEVLGGTCQCTRCVQESKGC